MALRTWFETDVNELSALAEAWQALGARALEPNPFYEPWFVLPALRRLPELGRDRGVLFVADGAVLVAAVPLHVVAVRRGVPLRRARLLTHKYTFCHTPLLAGDRAREAWLAVLDWCHAQTLPVLELEQSYADGPFHALVDQVAAERGLASFVRASSDRAVLLPDADAETYIAKAMSSKHRRETARRERLLRGLGDLRLPELGFGHDGDVAPYIAGFLELEASGWKGKEGTAFASSPTDRAFFAEAVDAGHAARRIWFQNVVLDGKLVASLLSFVAGESSFSWKICHDEKLSKVSPGVFVEIVNLRRVHERHEVTWMDSGATPDHSMLNRIWADRKTIETRWVTTGSRIASFMLRALPIVKALKSRWDRRATPTAGTPVAEPDQE